MNIVMARTEGTFKRQAHCCPIRLKANLAYSLNSVDDLLAIGEEDEDSIDVLADELDQTIESLLDRNWKRSSVQIREAALSKYIRILTSRYSRDDIEGKELQLAHAFLKSIKSDSSEIETILALKGTSSCVWRIICYMLTNAQRWQ